MLSNLDDKIQYMNSSWQLFIEHLLGAKYNVKDNENT